MEQKKLVLIDGHSILNRAFYGVPDLTNAAGLHTNAIYGFLNILFKVLEEEKPEYLVVAFDVHAPTFRHQMYDAYKGTRKPMPEELRQQVPVLKEVLQAMGILIVEKAGLEADDILGTLAKTAEKDGLFVALVSGDRDLLQIATERIKIRIPKTKMGRTEVEDYFAKDVLEAYQVTPKQFIELKALMGDTADNIPGVPKVGQKTATELMVTYGSIENIYAHLEEISKKSIRQSLEENKNLAELSLALATIKIDADTGADYRDGLVGDFYTPEAYVLFKKLEFKNFLGKFDSGKEMQQSGCRFIEKGKQLQELIDLAKQKKQCSIQLYHGKNGLIGMALSVEGAETGFAPAGDEFGQTELTSCMQDMLESGVTFITFQVKELYPYIKNEHKYVDNNQLFDVLIAAYLLNPLKNDYQVEDIANEYLGLLLSSYAQLFGKLPMDEAFETKQEQFVSYAGSLVDAMTKAKSKLESALRETAQDKLFYEIEMPLSRVLYHMEKEGVMVKPEELKAYGETLSGRIQELEGNIWDKAGEQFNINSPKQLGEILFGKMQIPGGKKTKTGYSTAADVLEKLAPEYPIIHEILEYRGLTKLKSTYADGLAAFIGEDQRIHTTFNQTITATGRISSTEPNLQNIPMRMELGRKIRKVFVAKEGYTLMDADYSQIELRVLASMSGDEQLIEAYKQEADIHRITASKVFHVEPDQVTDLQRRNAKAVNFGIVYGISSFGLSQDLSISRKEAAEYIDKYFETYPGIKVFLDQAVARAKESGYSVTMFGRRRPIPELSSSNFMQRSFGERVAMNAPIQGTAADIMKIAMIRVEKRLREEGLHSKLILQVHDELLIETARDEVQQVQDILANEMVHAARMAVTLEIDLNTGDNWYDAH